MTTAIIALVAAAGFFLGMGIMGICCSGKADDAFRAGYEMGRVDGKTARPSLKMSGLITGDEIDLTIARGDQSYGGTDD